MEMFLDIGGDMGVTGKSGNESCSCDQYSLFWEFLASGRSFQRRGAVMDMARLENMRWEVNGGVEKG